MSEHKSVSIEELHPYPNSYTKKGETSFKKKKDTPSIDEDAYPRPSSIFVETPKVPS
jgi:hypothetical protein